MNKAVAAEKVDAGRGFNSLPTAQQLKKEEEVKLKLTQFEAAQLMLQATAILTSGVLANPLFRPNYDLDLIRHNMQESAKAVREMFDVLGIEVKD